MTWGDNWTNNSVYKYQEEDKRQRAVVKKFIQDHPEYDSTNQVNNKKIVDYIEPSKRPFTTETIEWAYRMLFTYPAKSDEIQAKLKKISTSLNNTTMSDVIPELDNGGLKGNTALQAEINMLAKIIEREQQRSERSVDTPSVESYDKEIAPTKTERRIKEDVD